MKEEALNLADWLDRRRNSYEPNGESADMIRKLVAELDRYKMAWNMAENEIEKLKEELNCANDYIKKYQLEEKKIPFSNTGFLFDDVKKKGGL